MPARITKILTDKVVVMILGDIQKRKKGRPTVAQKYYGDAAKQVTMIWEAGGNIKTKRSTADYIYCTTALRIIKEAASEIPFVELIYKSDNSWFSRSILSQLGRMSIQDGYDDNDVIAMAKIAAIAIHENCTVREVETYIRNGRKTGEW